MAPRFLFGPTTADFADSRLGELRRARAYLAFGPAGVDVTIDADMRWAEIAAQLPDGWWPDVIALWLNYVTVPACFWSAPAPLIGLATDWNVLWHGLRHLLPHCDAVLTDRPGVETLARAGIHHARPAILYGAAPDSLMEPAAGERDIDILFVGNVHPAVQRERLAWLGRIARLGGRRNVVIRTGTSGSECRALLARAKIVFNRSIRSEANMRAFEAAAAGALLFEEAGNRELPEYFADRRECVYYRDEDLEALLEHHLTHEEERQAIAEAARAKVASCTFSSLLVRGLEALWDEDRPGLCERARKRVETNRDQVSPSGNADGPGPSLAARVWIRLCDAGRISDRDLKSDLATAAEAGGAHAAAAWHALGVLAPDPREAVGSFRRGVAAEPNQIVSGLALATAFALSGRRDEAVEQARRVLEGLDAPERSAETDRSFQLAAWDLPTFPAQFNDLRVEWERAAWLHAGDPAGEVAAKRTLVRWRLHALLAELTDDVAQFEAAAAAGPDLPSSHAALGCALARAGRLAAALPHLRRAVAGQPFDAAAARAWFQVLVDLGLSEEQREFISDRRLLAKAAPQVVRPEPWFSAQGPPAPGPGADQPDAPARDACKCVQKIAGTAVGIAADISTSPTRQF